MLRKIPFLFVGLFLTTVALASDLEFTTVDADEGMANGAIDLEVSGGVAPFAFEWVGPDGFSSTAEDLSDLEAGVYTVTVTDTYCGVATVEIEVMSKSNVSIVEDDEELALTLYPNPTSGIVNIKSNTSVDIVVYNVVGEIIVQGKNLDRVDLSNQPAGIYLIKASSEKGTITRKITLQ